ncbi:MAG: cytochrome c, partial [Nitrospirae bacterium]|nr:cytochrome c [Nitrospirota bacterium]
MIKTWFKAIVISIIGILSLDIAIALALTDEEMNKAKGIFFNRCAGCHGTLRKGATGPEITDTKLKSKNYNTDIIKAFITNGTGGGMPGFVKMGLLTADEADLMARFVQVPPPIPPEM